MMKQSGFTLIELIIVISIMVVVFAVGLPLYSSYTSARAFDALVEETRSQARFVYTNSVQGVLALDKVSSDNSGSPPADRDPNSDRVAWFMMIDKGLEQYAVGACLPNVRPNSINTCINDRDYRLKNISETVNINFTVPVSPSYGGNVVYVAFTPITGQATVWGNSGANPLVTDRDFDIILTSKSDATNSATIKINAQGGIR